MTSPEHSGGRMPVAAATERVRQAALDVIIVNYKSTDLLLRCLRSIGEAADGHGIRVFIQDNHSNDGVERVRRAYPQVHLTMNSSNLGFARAVNQALAQGEAPYVLILNPDTVVEEGFFTTVLEFMESRRDVGILGPRILDYDGAIQGSARSFPTPLTALFGRKSFLTRVFPNNRITRENILTTRCDGINPMEVDWVSGACILARREAIRDVGVMDDGFFMYWEDADWCRRMWEGGWRVVYFPRASIMHFVGASSEKNITRSVLEFHKSIYRLFVKYVRPPLAYLKPMVFWGLIFRFFFVLSTDLVRKSVSRIQTRALLPALPPRLPEPIRVVRIIARLNIGGPSIHVHLLSKGLDHGRFTSTLVTGKISPQEGDMSYLFENGDPRPLILPELQREISLGMDVRAVLRILRILRARQPHIVHTHTAKAGTSARLAVFLYNVLWRKQVRIVHTFHGHVFHGYFSRAKSAFFVWIERSLARFTDVIIAISRTQREELADHYRIAPYHKIRMIELGFDLNPFLQCARRRGLFRKRLGIDERTRLIGIVGRLVPIKNHVMFLRAARLFLNENPHLAVKFIVVGDGELRQELEDSCRRNSLEEHVIFCGWTRQVPDVYADLDILALTSRNEGTPVSIIEAMASSVPVIATDAGGVLDLIGRSNGRPSRSGFVLCDRGVLCRRDDSVGFARGLKFMVEDTSAASRERVRRARAFVKERYSEQRLLRDMEALYVDLMKVGRGAPGRLDFPESSHR